ncbi:MAG: hypothetical protein IPL46_13665 [Saprospiraceae bacterium]|nr:hypothetical protein [Saprospiraceae bacterium]
MALKILLIINTALCLFRGVGFIFAPTKLWKAFNVDLDNSTKFPAQLLGAAYIATAAINLTATNFIDKSTIQSVIIFNFIIEIIGAMLTVAGILRNAISKLGWLPFSIHLTLAIAFGYFLFDFDI